MSASFALGASLGWRPERAAATGTLRIARHLRAAPATAFAAWLDPAVARRWLFATATEPLAAAEIDARVQGAFRFAAHRGGRLREHRGTYLEIAPPWRLTFTLQVATPVPAITRVAVSVAPRRRGCTLSVVHEGLPRAATREMRERWIGMLYGLDATLADGIAPLRSER